MHLIKGADFPFLKACVSRFSFASLMASALVRVVSTIVLCVLVFNLFYLGAKPVAVGLFQPPWDKVAHFATFSMISLLLWVGVFRRRAWWLVPVAGLVAAADELHQMSLPGRSPSWDDFAFDLAAIVICTIILTWVDRRMPSGNARGYTQL